MRFYPLATALLISSSALSLRAQAPSRVLLDDKPVSPSGSVTSIGFSRDGRFVAASGGDRRPHVWDIQSRKPVPLADAHPVTCAHAIFGPGDVLLSAGVDGGVLAWDLSTGRSREILPGKGPEECPATICPDGLALIRAGSAWALPEGELVRAYGSGLLRMNAGGTSSLVLSSDGLNLVWGQRVFEVSSGRDLFYADGSYPAFAPGSAYFVTATDTHVQFWDGWNGHELLTRKMADRPIAALAVAPDPIVVAVADEQGGVTLWHVAREMPLATLASKEREVSALHFSMSGSWLAAGVGKAASIVLWDVRGQHRQAAKWRRTLSDRDLVDLWERMARAGKEEADVGAFTFIQAGDRGIPFLCDRLQGDQDLAAEIVECIRRLDHDDFTVRDAATRRLEQFGRDAVPFLKRTLEGSPSPEARERITTLLNAAAEDAGPSLDQSRRLKAIGIVERIGTNAAHAALLLLSEGGCGNVERQEALISLKRLDWRRDCLGRTVER